MPENDKSLMPLISTPTAAENFTAAMMRLAHKKMVLLILTAIYLKDAHPAYLLVNALIGTAAILAADYFNERKDSNERTEK